jgi:maltooligosyltrehalose trehalohydrolase
MSFRLERGAQVRPEGGVDFAVWAPHAKRVEVRIEGLKAMLAQALEAAGGGVFAGHVAPARAGSDYRFRLDGDGPWLPDPVSRLQPEGIHGPSRVVGPAFPWSDGGWRGVARPELVTYELHVGTFSEPGDFDGVVPALEALAALGVTALELMPVAAFPGRRNWGYDGVFPYAPHVAYGGPEGLRRLVDAAHGAGLAVFLDVVYNHLGPEGNVLPAYGPYFSDRHRTPWGAALNFDGPESDEVRRYFLDNALHWLTEYHLDGLRLDAVHAIVDTSARPFLAELAEAVGELEGDLGRPLHLIAESDANDPRLVRAATGGGLGLDAVWNDDFHHAVHAALTGERDGYYVDYGGTAALAKSFEAAFVFDGGYSEHRRRRHGASARDVARDRFVACIQNHDQIGNRARGERLTTLLDPASCRLAAALLLLAPGLPLLFMGEEWGETAPFLYFVDHEDEALLAAVREGRRREFAGFDFGGDVPDPAAPETFARSRPDPDRARSAEGEARRRLYARLLALRREEPALRPDVARVHVRHDEAGRWLRVAWDGARPLFAAFALGPEPARLESPATATAWRRRFASEDDAFGGAGEKAPERLPAGAPLEVAPRSALLYAAELA